MSSVINQNAPGSIRNKLIKGIVISFRRLMEKKEIDDECKDIISFITLALDGIHDTVETSVLAWEKRDYWVKADKFRMEWAWVSAKAQELTLLVRAGEWQAAMPLLIEVGQRFSHIKVSTKHRMGEPWHGAWQEFKRKSG